LHFSDAPVWTCSKQAGGSSRWHDMHGVIHCNPEAGSHPPPAYEGRTRSHRRGVVRYGCTDRITRANPDQPTLRKDLTILERQGLLKRTHGGALSTRAPAERDLMTRFVQNVAAKQAIGLASCDLIEEGEAIFLDCGTTTHHIAQHLASRGLHLTVLTN